MGVNDPISVLVVDDEGLMRAGIRLMIDGVGGIAVAGEASDGLEAIEAARALDPDVVLMDIRMPRMDGIDATRELVAAGTRARVIILTAFDTDEFLLDALRAGAISFLLKDAAPEFVIEAVREAADGRARVSPAVLSRLIGLTAGRSAGNGHHAEEASATTTAPEGITDREWDVGRLVARGMTNAEIAESLFLGQTTVKTHLASLFAKLHVTNRVQLAIRVLEHDGRP